MSFTPSPETRAVMVNGAMNLHLSNGTANAGIMFGGGSIFTSSNEVVFQLGENKNLTIQSNTGEPAFQINQDGTVKLNFGQDEQQSQQATDAQVTK
jgi:hypothetical protein